MKKVFIILLFLLLYNINSNAQCYSLLTVKGFEKLDTATYVFDGSVNISSIDRGGKFTVKKTLYKGQKYKIVVVSDKFTKMNIFIVNNEKLTLFENNYSSEGTWNYTCGQNESIDIIVEIPKDCEDVNNACVAILLGLSA